MGTDITQGFPKDARTGLTLPLRTSLGSQDLAKHRAMIGMELEVMAKKVDRFGWDRDRGSAVQDRLMIDWMDALQDYPLDEVQAACRSALLDSPSKMPNEGHVLAKIMAERARRVRSMPRRYETESIGVGDNRAAQSIADAQRYENDMAYRAQIAAGLGLPVIKRFGAE